jgi:hypothetical protein
MAFFGSVNNYPVTGAEAIYALKTLLKDVSVGWTIPSSSDGTTYNASGDQISSGSSGANGLANNSAWFRVKCPSTYDGYSRELIFQRGTTNLLWRIKYSHSAGFTGGSPNATRTPSATDEATLFGGGTDASPTFTALFGADSSYNFNAVAGNGADGYAFWCGAFPHGGGAPNMAFVMENLLPGTYPTEDIDPYIFHVSQSQAFSIAGMSTSGCFGWLKKSMSGQGFQTIYAGRWQACGVSSFPGIAVLLDAAAGPTSGLGVNSHTNKDDFLPIFYTRRGSLSAPNGYKGIGRIMYFATVGRTTGDTYTEVSSRDKIYYGSYVLPWVGVVPVV